MKIIRWLYISIPIVIILYIIYQVYVGIQGNPITKYYFKKEIKNYLDKTYPESIFTIHIGYGFKEMNYYGNVSPINSSNLEFRVERDYNGNLYDTYLTVSLDKEVTEQCEVEIKKYFPRATCNPDIRLDSNKTVSDKSLPFPNYNTMKNAIDRDSKIIIYIEEFDEKSIKSYEEALVNFITEISDLELSLSIELKNKWMFVREKDLNDIRLSRKINFKELESD